MDNPIKILGLLGIIKIWTFDYGGFGGGFDTLRTRLIISNSLTRLRRIFVPDGLIRSPTKTLMGKFSIRFLSIFRRKWIGNILKKQDGAIEKDVLYRKLQGEWEIGRGREPWQRSVIKELGRVLGMSL